MSLPLDRRFLTHVVIYPTSEEFRQREMPKKEKGTSDLAREALAGQKRRYSPESLDEIKVPPSAKMVYRVYPDGKIEKLILYTFKGLGEDLE